MIKILTGFSHYPLMQEAGADGGAGAADSKAADGGGAAAESSAESGAASDSLLDGVDGDGDAGDQTLDFTKGKPEGYPDEAWDEEKKAPKADVLYQKLQAAEKRAADLRAKLGKGEHKAPKDAKDYTIDAGEKGKALLRADDPLLAEAQKVAHELGIPKETYGKFMGKLTDFMAEHIEKLSEAGAPELTDEQKAEIRQAEYAKIGTNAVQIIKSVESWGRELKASGQLSEAELAAFKSMAMTGEQVRVLNKLRALAGGGNALPMDFSDDGLPSDEEIAEKIANIKSESDERKVNELLDKRRKAGRPEKLQIRA